MKQVFRIALVIVATFTLFVPVGWINAPARAAPSETAEIRCNSFLPPHGNFIGCDGDCDLNGTVGVEELIRIVKIILGSAPADICPALPSTPTVADVVQAIPSVFEGCPAVAQYRLTEGSAIAYYAGSPTPTIEEALSGTFMLVDRGIELQFVDAQITNVDLRAEDFSVTGGPTAALGCLRTSLSPPPNVDFSATILVNGISVSVLGATGTVLTPVFPPLQWSDIETCGASDAIARCDQIKSGVTPGYALTLFAQLDE